MNILIYGVPQAPEDVLQLLFLLCPCENGVSNPVPEFLVLQTFECQNGGSVAAPFKNLKDSLIYEKEESAESRLLI